MTAPIVLTGGEGRKRTYSRNGQGGASGAAGGAAADAGAGAGGAGSDDPIARMTAALGSAIEGVRADARAEAIEAVEAFSRRVEATRSRRPPVPPDDERRRERDDRPADLGAARSVDYSAAREFHVIGDARDGLYRRMEQGRAGLALAEFRVTRNPGMDAIAARWANAVASGNVAERVRLYDELNDRYLKAMGISRASLLEGLPTGENPLSNGSGAELLPLPLANQLIVERDKASKFRGLVNVFPMTAQVQRIPVLPTVTATARLENASYTDNTPTADSALLTAKDIGVLFSAGRNFLEDSAFNIVNQLTVVAGGAIGAEEDIQICTSTANAGDITQGLEAATVTDVAETTTGAIGFVDLVSLYYALPEQYRRNAKFFAAGTTLADLAKLVDAVGRPILLDAVQAPRAISDWDQNAVGTILGKPVYDVPLTDEVIFFGDPMWYALGQRSGIRVDTDRAVTTGNRQWVIDERIDGRVIPTSAVGTNNAWRKIIY